MQQCTQLIVCTQILLVMLLSGAAPGQIAIIEDHPGIDQVDSGVEDSQPPPDPDLAVSPDAQTGEVVQVVNRLIRVWDRSGLTVKDEAPLIDFFGNLSGGAPTDPRVIYDPGEDRFLATAFAGTPRQLVVAISPQGGATPLLIDEGGGIFTPTWSVSTAEGAFDDTDVVTSMCAGPPNILGTLGLDQPRVARGLNFWSVSGVLAGGSESLGQDNAIYFIDKEPEIGPGGEEIFTITGPIFTSTFPDPLGPGGLVGCDTLATAGAEIITPARDADTDIAYFAGLEWDLFPDSSCPGLDDVNSLRIFAVEDPLGAAVKHFTRIKIRCFDPDTPCAATSTMLGGDLSTLDARVTSVSWKEEPVAGGGTDEFLYVVHTINSPIDLGGDAPEPRAAIQWQKIRLNGWPLSTGQPAVVTGGRIAASPAGDPLVPVHLFFPAGVVNDDLDFMIVMAQSSEVEVPSIRAWARKDSGVQSFVTLLKESATGDVPGNNVCARYGDYFDIHLSTRRTRPASGPSGS